MSTDNKNIIENPAKWTKEDRFRVDHVYTDRNKNEFFMLKDITKISMARATAAEATTRMAELCLTKDTLNRLMEKQFDALNKQDLVTAATINQEVVHRLRYVGEEETLLALATVYFFLENEPIDYYDDYWQDVKLRLWKKDEVAKSFFLQEAWTRTKQYKTMSETDILWYLREANLLEKSMRSLWVV